MLSYFVDIFDKVCLKIKIFVKFIKFCKRARIGDRNKITFRFYADIVENKFITINYKLKKAFQDFSFYHINQNNVYLDDASQFYLNY